MKRNCVLGFMCVLVLLISIVACGTKEVPGIFTGKNFDYLPISSEFVEDPNAPEGVRAIAQKVDGLLPSSAKDSSLWKHYTITNTVTLYPVQIVRAFDSHYRARGWKNGFEEVEMPQEAFTGNWMLWYKPAGDVISATVLIVIPEEIEEGIKDEQASEERQYPVEHVILGRWALPKQDEN